MSEILLPLRDPAEVSKLKAIVRRITDAHGNFDTQWLDAQHWIAVPVESASHFNEHDADHLSQAIQSAGIPICYAVATEALEHFPDCYRVVGTVEGLLEFSRACAHFNFLLTSASLDFAVLCTVYDYFVISGARTFVERALGCALESARVKFIDFAKSSDEPDRLVGIARRYKSSGSAPQEHA